LRKLVIFTTIIATLYPAISLGQIFHTDPYQIDFLYLNIEQSKQDIKHNKVKEISSYYCDLSSKGTKIKKDNNIYTVTFDIFGNPTKYNKRSILACWWWPKLLQTLRIQKQITTTYDYFFIYDSLQNLIHAKELIVKSISSNHDENDVYFVYDKQKRLINQTISNKTIYKSGFKYRGVSYQNDTFIIKYSFFYNNDDEIASITAINQWRDNDNFQSMTKFDTLIFNKKFDSLFISKVDTKGIKHDSLGRIVESINYSVHATSIGGDYTNPDSPNDIITRYFYNSEGKLLKSESQTRKGEFVRRLFWTYSKTGLLQSIQAEDAKQLITYQYEFY